MCSKRTLAVALAVLSGISRGQGYLGEGWETFNARSVALGGVGVASGAGWMAGLNPATLAGMKRIALTVAGGARLHSERRSFPVIDMFGDRVTDNIYVSNHAAYSTAAWALAWRPLGLPLAVGAGEVPFEDHRYDYEEHVRGVRSSSSYNRDPLVGLHQIARGGVVMQQGVEAAWRLGRLAIGVSVNRLAPVERMHNWSVTVYEPDDALASDSSVAWEGMERVQSSRPFFSAGAIWAVSRRISAGAHYREGVTVTSENAAWVPAVESSTLLPDYAWNDTVATVVRNLPSSLTIGVEVRPMNPLATRLFVEVESRDWPAGAVSVERGGKTTDVNLPMRRTAETRVGVEHEILGLLVRAGFAYRPSPFGGQLDQSVFSAGAGWAVVRGVTLDIAAQFHNSAYAYRDLFPAPADTRDDLESVRELSARFLATVRYEL